MKICNTYLLQKINFQTLSGAKILKTTKFPNFQEGTPNLMHFITKTRLFKYTETSTTKKMKIFR